MKVIIVDNAQHVREGLGQHLERQGHDVIQCASAHEALLRADSYDADLLVTGEHLIDMTGEQMVKQFHRWARYRTLPVLVLKKEAHTKNPIELVLH